VRSCAAVFGQSSRILGERSRIWPETIGFTRPAEATYGRCRDHRGSEWFWRKRDPCHPFCAEAKENPHARTTTPLITVKTSPLAISSTMKSSRFRASTWDCRCGIRLCRAGLSSCAGRGQTREPLQAHSAGCSLATKSEPLLIRLRRFCFGEHRSQKASAHNGEGEKHSRPGIGSDFQTRHIWPDRVWSCSQADVIGLHQRHQLSLNEVITYACSTEEPQRRPDVPIQRASNLGEFRISNNLVPAFNATFGSATCNK